jgi:hypothetical protein
MHDIRHSVKIWLDDNMIHVTDEGKLLEVLEYFFNTCLQHGLFLHAAKCDLYGTELRYCGRIITAEGVWYDPRTMSTLQQMGTPQNGGDLVQYVAALNWMRSQLTAVCGEGCTTTGPPRSSLQRSQGMHQEESYFGVSRWKMDD